MEDRALLPHKLILNERQSMTLTGVTEVVSFDENIVVMTTALGSLAVHGNQLQLKTLSLENGQVAIDGHIAALIYEEPKPAGGIWRRLFGG